MSAEATTSKRRKKEASTATLSTKVYDGSGKASGERGLKSELFGAPARRGELHEVVRWQRAKSRAGTHSVQTRAETSGGGIKPWKQKGTGRARAGSNTSPLWVGGGIAHGPKVRSYEFKMNRKQRAQALLGALSARQEEGRILVVEDFGIKKSPKTKEALEYLRKVGVVAGERVLVVLPVEESSSATQKSFRNIEGVTLVSVNGVNVYDVVSAHKVIFTTKALEAFEARGA